MIAAAKKRGAEKAKLTKSLIIMDVKPWDDTTGKHLLWPKGPCMPLPWQHPELRVLAIWV